ncbi:DegT/DnrJ/EryC1/StrS family aminotransferase [Ferrovibrio sp.]|uniref:DegT/DnrJ/EryC1/StrS family aminotransferase n=1 Tax=Ferrovibrio sp. TaxID=1917215 RepID=UPI0035B0C798
MEFIDLKTQYQRLKPRIDARIHAVLDHGQYILGPEVAELERQLAAYCGTRHAVTCANGTDALTLVLLAAGVTAGDAVFMPAFTFVATAEVVPPIGATPFFVDVSPETFNMNPESLKAGIAEAKKMGLRPRAVIPVDLFGQPADYTAIREICLQHDLLLIADAAQSFGASLNNRRVGTLGDFTTTSFFPAKPLGCYGDGGAIFTDDDDKVDLLRSLRFHGKGSDKYDNVRLGLNSRLDTLQAAVLLEKLAVFPDEVEARNQVARRYNEGLGDVAVIPRLASGATSVWAQYTILMPNRDQVVAACKAAGVPTAVYYPIPLNQQTGYKMYPSVAAGVPVSERLAQQVLSLPMHPFLERDAQDRVIETVRRAISA